MNKKKIISLGILCIILITSIVFLYQMYSNSESKAAAMNSRIVNLETDLREAKEKISKLESEKSSFEAKISSAKHFDKSIIISDGLSEVGTYYTGQVLETQIDGEFEGWEGETIFKMMNGTIWQQASYDYTYHYAYMPNVIIYRKGGAYYMKVEDVDEEIQVIQLR